MSDVLIKGWERPAECRDCAFCNYSMNTGETICDAGNFILADESKAIAFEGRHKDCPLVEIPEHGDLIDKQKLIGGIICELGAAISIGDKKEYDHWNRVLMYVRKADTVIPASKEET